MAHLSRRLFRLRIQTVNSVAVVVALVRVFTGQCLRLGSRRQMSADAGFRELNVVERYLGDRQPFSESELQPGKRTVWRPKTPSQ
jgi:hypothetical protein